MKLLAMERVSADEKTLVMDDPSGILNWTLEDSLCKNKKTGPSSQVTPSNLLYLYIPIAPLRVHINQMRLKCKRPKE